MCARLLQRMLRIGEKLGEYESSSTSIHRIEEDHLMRVSAYRTPFHVRATPSRAELEGGSVGADSWSSLHPPTCVVHGGSYLGSGTNIHLDPLGRWRS